MIRRPLAVSILALMLPPLAGFSADGGLSIRMVSEVKAIVPGEAFYVGLVLKHDPGYHTYWKCPGIVGVPTQIEWDLPKGFKGEELEFPEPELVHMYEIKAQGYERDVLLQAKITPPADLDAGTDVTLSGKAWWMCCAHECNPGSGDLSITLPVTDGEAPLWNTDWRPWFQRERGRFAVETEEWVASSTEKGDEIRLTLRPKSETAISPSADEASEMIVFTEDGWFDSDKPQEVELLPGGAVRFRLTKAAVYLEEGIPERLLVIVQKPSNWLKDRYSRSLRLAPVIQR